MGYQPKNSIAETEFTMHLYCLMSQKLSKQSKFHDRLVFQGVEIGMLESFQIRRCAATIDVEELQGGATSSAFTFIRIQNIQ